MADLVVLVPSRGRPEAARSLIAAFRATCTARTELAFIVDASDPSRDEYGAAVRAVPFDLTVRASVGYADNEAGTMVGALNEAAVAFANQFQPAPYALGFMGDDHLPRTVGWDERYLHALRAGTAIVYGNDLLQRKNLPTQCAMRTDVVRALGFMAPPVLRHLYVDNFWLDLGRALPAGITYLPDVIVEHRHPVAGKAAMDVGYERVNAPEAYATDEAAYAAYQAGPLADDVERVKAVLA